MVVVMCPDGSPGVRPYAGSWHQYAPVIRAPTPSQQTDERFLSERTHRGQASERRCNTDDFHLLRNLEAECLDASLESFARILARRSYALGQTPMTAGLQSVRPIAS